jgi:hypothetical protein
MWGLLKDSYLHISFTCLNIGESNNETVHERNVFIKEGLKTGRLKSAAVDKALYRSGSCTSI